MKVLKKWMVTVLAVVSSQPLGLTAHAKPDWPSDVGVASEAGIVIDADSGTMIYGQNSRLPYYPASITKLMTGLIVLEHASLDEIVNFSEDAVYNVESGSGNPLGISVGDKLSVKDCLYAMLLRSSNQAANALAEHVAGSRDGFADMMNVKLSEFGCTGSKFKNPSGLNDPEQVVTPYDMAVIAKAAFENPQLLEISSARSYRLPAMKNHPEGFPFSMGHKILKAETSGSQFFCEGAIAGKTGYTSAAGNTLVTYAERNGRRLIAVILKGKPTQYYLDTIGLLNFGFNNFKNVDVTQMEKVYISGDEEIVIGDGRYKPEELEFDEPAVVTLPLNAEYEDAEKTFDTNVPKGSPEGALAILRYTYNERKVGEVYLCLKQEEAGLEEVNGPAEELMVNLQPGGKEVNSFENKPGKGPSRNKRITWILAGLGGVVVIVSLAGAGYYIYEVKKERKQAQQRRDRRRQRLLESGIPEEEFERLLSVRRNKRQEG